MERHLRSHLVKRQHRETKGATMASRLFFLCARHSSRSLIAASLLAAQTSNRWDIWCSPTQDTHGLQLAEQVLSERDIPLIASEHCTEPVFGMQWDEGIILCSGLADI